jgi:hypothetical protein
LGLAVSPAFARPIAVADGEQAGVLRIEITELQRSSGETVTQKFTLVKDTGENINPYACSRAMTLGTSTSSTQFIGKNTLKSPTVAPHEGVFDLRLSGAAQAGRERLKPVERTNTYRSWTPRTTGCPAAGSAACGGLAAGNSFKPVGMLSGAAAPSSTLGRPPATASP